MATTKSALPYAQSTKVPVPVTVMQIETLVKRHGATGFGWAWIREGQEAGVTFDLEYLRIVFHVLVPQPHEQRFVYTPQGKRRTAAEARSRHEQAVRAQWRAVLALIRAKLIGIAQGITSIEHEFATRVPGPDGRPVVHLLVPQLRAYRETGQLPGLLPGAQE